MTNGYDRKLVEILQAKEDRALRQKELLNRYSSALISFALNIPGPDKDTSIYRKVHEEGMKALKREIIEQAGDILHEEINYRAAGQEGFLCVKMDAAVMKAITVKIEEEHPMGRLFDMDVINTAGIPVGRMDVGHRERKCLLCDEKAVVCSRSKRHPLNELLQKIHELIEKHNFLIR